MDNHPSGQPLHHQSLSGGPQPSPDSSPAPADRPTRTEQPPDVPPPEGLRRVRRALLVVGAAAVLIVGTVAVVRTADGTVPPVEEGGSTPDRRGNAVTPDRRGNAVDALTSKEVYARNVTATVRVLQANSTGSGVVIDAEDGIVVTNAHVATSSGSLSVVTSSGERVSARRLGVAPCEDLAVIQLNAVPADVTAAEVGDSSILENQDEVTAIGFPANFDAGAVHKPVSSSGHVQVPRLDASPDPSLPTYAEAIQHDATVNPGNSGGPLFDDHGRLVGINSLAASTLSGRNIENQFYAISTEHALPVIEQLQEGLTYSDVGLHGLPFDSLGLDELKTIYPSYGATLAQAFRESDVHPFFIERVESGSSAADAALVAGDIIDGMDGQAVTTFADVCAVLASTSPGDAIEVTGYWGEDGEDHRAIDSWSTEMQVGKSAGTS